MQNDSKIYIFLECHFTADIQKVVINKATSFVLLFFLSISVKLEKCVPSPVNFEINSTLKIYGCFFQRCIVVFNENGGDDDGDSHSAQ